MMYQWNLCNCVSNARVLVLNNSFCKLEVCICIRILWDLKSGESEVVKFFLLCRRKWAVTWKAHRTKKATISKHIGCLHSACDTLTAYLHSSLITILS